MNDLACSIKDVAINSRVVAALVALELFSSTSRESDGVSPGPPLLFEGSVRSCSSRSLFTPSRENHRQRVRP